MRVFRKSLTPICKKTFLLIFFVIHFELQYALFGSLLTLLTKDKEIVLKEAKEKVQLVLRKGAC